MYTCDDGRGTFELLKHLQLTFTGTGFTTAGPLEILGGTFRAWVDGAETTLPPSPYPWFVSFPRDES